MGNHILYHDKEYEGKANMKTANTIRLNVGCGRDSLPGWVNLDCVVLPGVDVLANLDQRPKCPLPFADNTVDEFLLSHVLEHIHNPLPLMEELHRIARPRAVAIIRVPYGATDDAYEDPTHVRQFFLSSFGYFSQPLYWRADYGYRGDWRTRQLTLMVDRKKHEGMTPQEILSRVNQMRNVVKEMVAELTVVKPIREPRKELQTVPHIKFCLI